MEASLWELKAHLSEYIRRVAAGEEVTVTLRGKPVARLSPVQATKSAEELEAEAVDHLDALPWIRPGDGRPVQGSDRPIPWPADEKPLSTVLLEERR